MDGLPLKLTLLVAALVVGSATPSAGQPFEYTPYKGYNNTGQANEAPPPDNYTPTHQGSATAPAPENGNGAAAPTDQGDARQGSGSTAYDGNRAAASAGETYSPSRGTYSPSEDVFSPSRGGRETPPPPSDDAYPPVHEGHVPPPHGVGGPPGRDFAGDLPRIEVHVAAPDDGIPNGVREHDARRAAIEGWQAKVTDRYGPEFSQWQIAVGKHIDCHPDRRDGIICTASAQPVRGFGRYGQEPRDDRY